MADRQSGTLKCVRKKIALFMIYSYKKAIARDKIKEKKQMEYSEVTPLIGITKASPNEMILLKYCFISLVPPIQIAYIANCSNESYARVLFVVSRVNERRAIV